jgi:MarR family transcriptional regulator, 2-MHQ and catechol-resistance regulon repressor
MSRQAKKIQPHTTAAAESEGIHLWLILWKAYSAVRDYATRDIAALGLGLSDFAILELLLHKGPTPVNDIGEKVLLTSGSMTAAVDRLESRKLVERRTHPEDRRARLVDLTPSGRKLIECAFAEHAASMNALGNALTVSERAEVIRLLKKLGRAAQKTAIQG